MRNTKFINIILCLLIIGTIITMSSFAWTDRQNQAHEIAEMARDMGLPETNPIIVECQRIWAEEYNTYYKPPAEEQNINLFNGVLPYSVTYDYNTEALAVAFAKTIYGAARGIYSQKEQAAIVQEVYNRYYAGGLGTGNNLWSILTYPGQFEYSSGFPTYDDYGRDLTALARDVIYRNKLLSQGYTRSQAGIVLEAGYCWHYGDGSHNYFRNKYSGGSVWTWWLPNPYSS